MSIRLGSVLAVSALALLAGVALGQPAAAASPPSSTVAPLTVQGVAPPKMIEDQSYSFVQRYAAAPNPELGQISRWRDPVCVQVVGLPDEQGVVIKARIEAVAGQLGLPKAREGCRADVEIIFTDRPQAMMDAVAKRREELLGYYHRHDHDRLKKVTHPIQGWYVTSTMGESAYPVNNPEPLEVVDDPDNPPPLGCGISHAFTACVQSLFKNVLVVADSKALEGKDAGLVADYLVMLTLAQPKSLDGCNALPSVIDLLASSACPGRDVPDGLTPSDAAYLTALYGTDPESRKWVAEGDIAGRMAKILIKASASGG